MVTNVYREAVEAFGDQHQIVKAMEELGELISALARYTATPEGSLRLRALYADHVSEEMADVEIMLAESYDNVMIYSEDEEEEYEQDN